MPLTSVTDRCPEWVSSVDGSALSPTLAISPRGDRLYVASALTAETDVVQGTWISWWQITAYDAATGSQLWTTRYGDSPESSSAAPSSIAVTPDGSEVVVAGTVRPPEALWSCSQFRTVALRAADGSRIWQTSIDGSGDGQANCGLVAGLSILPDGSKVIASAPTAEAAGGNGVTTYRCTTREYDARNGGLFWTQQLSRAIGTFSGGCRTAVSEKGTLVQVATSLVAAGFAGGYTVAAYDTDSGDTRWAAQYQPPDHSNIELTSIAVDAAGGQTLVTGESQPNTGGNSEEVTIAYDSHSGAQRWIATASGQGTAQGAVRVDPHGSRAFVAGLACPPGANGVPSTSCGGGEVTVAYDARKGTQLWGVADPVSTAIAGVVSDVLVGPTGDEYTVVAAPAGSGTGANGSLTYVLAAHDPATGAVSWTMQYRNGEDLYDSPSAAALAPDGGHVFVTGVFGTAECAYDNGASLPADDPAPCQNGTIAVAT